jgi:ribitol-5-phosphate 2-dehydrogenase (NADP+) / D-ribitol-5-phosphate cytidylyltransferase
MRTVAAVLAGGSGRRFGTEVPKQLLAVGGSTVIEHSVAAFEQAAAVDEIVVVAPPGIIREVAALLAGTGFRKVSQVIEGGQRRPDSAQQAIRAVSSGDPDGECDLLLHDAARPLVDQATIAACVAALAEHQAVGVTIPSSDTVVTVEDGLITQVPSRDTIHRCQTPQGFRLSVIRRAYELAAADPGFTATDDCGVVLRYLPGVPVAVVPGSSRNIKITYPGDIEIAEILLKN